MTVAALASLNYWVDIGRPAHPIWDESYYLTTMQRYHDGTAQFASHPPLGLMLIAAGDALVGPDGPNVALSANKSVAGDQLPRDFSFVGPRIASGVFAVLGAVAFFLLMWQLTRELVPALLFSNLYIFENAFIVHFRAAQLDAFQITFLICALLCFVVGMRCRAGWLDFAFGLSIGCATMVKVSAVIFALLGVILIVRRSAPVRDVCVMSAGFLVAVVAVFTIHVAISPRPPDPQTIAGKKDLQLISPTYLEYLRGERSLTPRVIAVAATDYLRFIAADQAGVPKIDAHGSHPLEWPLGFKTINYRWDSDGAHTAYSQLVGNPVSGLASLLAIVLASALLVTRRISSGKRATTTALVLLYGVFMAAHLFLDAHRVLYLYHYFPALLIGFCLCPIVLQELTPRVLPALYTLTALLLAAFLFYAPLTFHRPLTDAECERRNVLQQIVDCRSSP